MKIIYDSLYAVIKNSNCQRKLGNKGVFGHFWKIVIRKNGELNINNVYLYIVYSTYELIIRVYYSYS